MNEYILFHGKMRNDTSVADLLEDISHFSQRDVSDKVFSQLVSNMMLPCDVHVTSSAWEDSEIRPWVESSIASHGGKQIALHFLRHPVTDVQLLLQRQQAYGAIRKCRELSKNVHQIEEHIHWLMTRPAIADSTSLQLLYPSFFALRFINHIPIMLAFLHVYKGYLAPLTNVATPLSTLFGPFFYLKKYMGSSMSFGTYFQLFKSLLSKLLKPSGDFKTNMTKFGTLGMYIGMFMIGIVQSLELASSVRKVQRFVSQKTKLIQEFVATNIPIIQQIPEVVWQAFGINGSNADMTCLAKLPRGPAFLYRYLTDQEVKYGMILMMQRLYVLEAITALQKLVDQKQGCFAEYNTKTPTCFYGMGHIYLPKNQVRNPCSLQRNLIVTGPNAGGKTTYVKSICSNYILAQTFGICVAQRAVICPQNAFGTFMRIHDEVGSKSLFESELSRCAEIVSHAKQMSEQGKTATYFLDEPMHSTPPAEGASTSIATVEYLGKLPGIRVVVTTHFYQLTQLASDEPQTFQNISMEAKHNGNRFMFPYRIHNGPSYQCIALELIQENNMIPRELISCAIKWKNKICPVHVK